MDDPKRISFTEKLDGWLRQRFAIPAGARNLARLTPVGNLNYRYGKVCELYLRLWPVVDEGIEYWPAKTLVIARLEFRGTRSGHGRALLAFLISQAEPYGYRNIALECTHDGDDIQGFAKKFGFEHAWPHHPYPHSNWITSVERVAERLNQTVLLP
jgi:GNAT superfamily N-acetyltransferase